MSLWEITESEEEEEKEQNQNDRNPDINNQQNLSPVIPPSQPQIQLPFQPPQQLNLNQMAYAPIAKLKKFTREENNIQADYFTVPQILNQFIRGLCNSILQCICPMHPADFQAAIINAKDFETAKLEANHAQAINLVMNRSFELDSKLKQFKSHSRHSKTEHGQNLNFQYYLSLLVTPEDAQPNNPETNLQPTLTSNILPATITENELLDAIFPFELKELSTILLFSGTTLEEKSITAMYTNAKVDGHPIKLILDSESAGSIITRQLIDQLGCQVNQTVSARIIIADRATKTLIGKINDLPIEINSIIVLIKVLVMEAIYDWMANVKVKGAMPNKILEIKNNSLKPANIVLIPNPDTFLDLKTSPKEFHKYYQNLAPTKEEQEQYLAQINTQLCDHCLIPCDFQYCNKCDLIYNPPARMIYMIPEEEKPISNCTSELKSIFNSNSNSNNNDNKNNGFSSAQYNNKINNNSDSNSNPKTYIALFDLSKKQELRWFSDNNKSIMSEHTHNINAEVDLRYPEKNLIKLESYLCTCINLKIALEILATRMVQLASRSSLVKKRINIREGIINAEYIGNIIAMLQNNSKKAYIIDPNEKIAQAIFLPLVKIAQLVSVRNKEELGITARRIQRFGSMGRIDVPVNMVEKKVIDKEKIIFTCQSISILPYNQYIVVIERKVKDQIQIFEVEATLCKLGKIELINLYIPAKNYGYIKISIYNNTGNVIRIPEEKTIGYLTIKIKNQLPDIIPDFPQLCRYVDITSQTIYE
ncbi:hypothetical protein G9A89_005917 [Geosiphon pyriformis]|nr:hypothetical protein G9A89_005917 [Geosiphon pyriformis]